ncbi:hypothetical protein SGRI78S_02134 [Streptomyces griseus subsp. griseus]
MRGLPRLPVEEFGQGSRYRRVIARRPGGPEAEDLALFVLVDRAQSPDAALRVRHERVEHAAEPLVRPHQVLSAVELRVAQQVDVQAAVTEGGVHRHRQIFDRADRQVVQGGPVGSETQGVVEGEDVDGRPGQRSPGSGQPRLVAQSLRRPALVPEYRPRLSGGPPGQIAHAVGGGDGEPHRQDRAEHGGRGPRGRSAATGDGQAEHDLAEPLLPVQAQRQRRHDERRPPGPGPLGRCLEPVSLHPAVDAPHRHRPVRLPVAGPRRGLGRVGSGEVRRPEPLVLHGLFGGQVGVLLLDDRCEGSRGTVLGQCARRERERGVDLGDPGESQDRGVAVERHVVDLLVKEVVRGRETVEGDPDQRARRQIGGLRQAEPHAP